jgi:hypothetical protein
MMNSLPWFDSVSANDNCNRAGKDAERERLNRAEHFELPGKPRGVL